ncbi:ATP-binding cassette domain-containing protein [Microbacterium sp. SYP-A9085]|nr:ABC transporter ATP-binding protein [Microbacterium sp. SYP-A9085]MRH29674.1 ATP-binding cassette domain-containing protein [Microbacterium sp. SYP-A9085]
MPRPPRPRIDAATAARAAEKGTPKSTAKELAAAKPTVPAGPAPRPKKPRAKPKPKPRPEPAAPVEPVDAADTALPAADVVIPPKPPLPPAAPPPPTSPATDAAPDDVVVTVAEAEEDVATTPEPAVAEDAATASPPLPALEVHGLAKSFHGTAAVSGIDLTVPAGTFYGVVGPNGAGKTTTLSMIAGLLRPDHGRILVNGVDAVQRPRAVKRLLGVLPDRLRTFDRLTGRQLLYYCGVLRGLDPALVNTRTGDLARAFDLTDALARPVSDYSAGMTKKVMLAGAMIHSPRLLVLDEPFEAVDPVSSAVILDILGAYVAHGGTVILSSHGMELVERVCTRVAVLVGGQVLAEGPVADVRGELTLEQRFVQLAGGLGDVEGLEWLHTFSD